MDLHSILHVCIFQYKITSIALILKLQSYCLNIILWWVDTPKLMAYLYWICVRYSSSCQCFGRYAKMFEYGKLASFFYFSLISTFGWGVDRCRGGQGGFQARSEAGTRRRRGEGIPQGKSIWVGRGQMNVKLL